MNAPDSSSPPSHHRPLSEAARDRLRDAIAQVYSDESRLPDLGNALRAAAAEAHDRGLRPEELIIALKALLDDIPEIPPTLSLRDRFRIRDQIVTACIKAYFRSPE